MCLNLRVDSSPIGVSTYVFTTQNYNAWKADQFPYDNIPAFTESCVLETECKLTLNFPSAVNHYIARLPPPANDDPTVAETYLYASGESPTCYLPVKLAASLQAVHQMCLVASSCC